VKEVISLITRKNYYNYYEGAVMKRDDSILRFETAQKKSDTSIADPTTSPERAKALERSLELATQAVMEAELHVDRRGSPSLVSKRQCWGKIIG
jgi:hypothetical protein